MNDPRTVTVLRSACGPFSVEAFPVNDDRALRRELLPMESSPDAQWTSLDQSRRDALVVLTRNALERLSRDPEDWLPKALVARSDSTFGFFVLWDNGHLEDVVLRQLTSAASDHERRLAELQRLAGRADEPSS